MTGQENILVVSAHAADFCSRSGGTIALHARRGAKVHVVGATYGERGESEAYWNSDREGKSIEEVKQLRAAEAEEAAAILGATIEFLDWDDYPLFIDKDRLLTLARLIRVRRPDIILTHWRVDPHNVDHQVNAEAVIRAGTLAAAPGFDADPAAVHPSVHSLPHIFFFEPTVPRNDVTGFVPDTFVDIGEVFDQKTDALRALRSQPKLVPWYTQWAEYRATQARQWSGRPIRYAEAFKRYTASVGERLPVMGIDGGDGS